MSRARTSRTNAQGNRVRLLTTNLTSKPGEPVLSAALNLSTYSDLTHNRTIFSLPHPSSPPTCSPRLHPLLTMGKQAPTPPSSQPRSDTHSPTLTTSSRPSMDEPPPYAPTDPGASANSLLQSPSPTRPHPCRAGRDGGCCLIASTGGGCCNCCSEDSGGCCNMCSDRAEGCMTFRSGYSTGCCLWGMEGGEGCCLCRVC